MKRISPIYYLLLGVITITAAQLNVSIDIIGWVAFVPFLIYLRKTQGIRSRLIFATVFIISWSVSIAKIVTPPMPVAMVFLYSIPISTFQLPGFLIWDKFRDQKWSLFLFPALLTILEWIQYSFTPLASWGIAAYSQSHTLPVLQTVSLFGISGLSFIVYWVNISISEIIVSKKATTITSVLPMTVTLLLVVFGSLRYDLSKINGS